MNSSMARILQVAAGFICGVLVLYLGGLGTLTVLNSSVLGGLLLPVIVGPLIAAALFWTAASAQSRAKRVTAGLIATAFSTGFFLAAAAWLYMVVTVLGPIATMS